MSEATEIRCTEMAFRPGYVFIRVGATNIFDAMTGVRDEQVLIIGQSVRTTYNALGIALRNMENHIRNYPECLKETKEDSI